MRVLFISYPLLPVSEESCGGAEQMLWMLEGELHRCGHETWVAACDGSRVSGRLIATGAAAKAPDVLAERETEHNCRVVDAIAEARNSGAPFDLIHDESGLFWRSAATKVPEPILATLHLPFDFYGAETFENVASNVTFNFVSQAQRESFAARNAKLRDFPVIANGIAVERFPLRKTKSNYLLWLGRICPEKGTHVAIDIASREGIPLIIAGHVYPFSYHQQYFEQQIEPRLSKNIRLVQQPDFAMKCELLTNAHALLVPTLVDETSSLVAMEAMACGTPVVAFRRGALSEVVEDGVTGFLVETQDEMLAALADVDGIVPETCRVRVERHFTRTRMAADYQEVYARILAPHQATAA